MLGHGQIKFPDAGLLATSAGRNWRNIEAELRRHPACDIPTIRPEDMEVTLTVSGSRRATVHRTGNGVRQSTIALPGTLWLCPIGVEEDAVRITAPIEEVLHLYLPASRFSDVSSALPGPSVRPDSIEYLAGFNDELVRQIGFALLAELRCETAGGHLLVEALAMALITRLAVSYAHQPATVLSGPDSRLDGVRLRRVLDFIHTNLTNDIAVEDLADVACQSRFHFSRAFKTATGTSPHAYVSQQRLAYASALLAHSETPIVDIALNCMFSSQTSFHRAFLRAKGVTPGQYRKQART